MGYPDYRRIPVRDAFGISGCRPGMHGDPDDGRAERQLAGVNNHGIRPVHRPGSFRRQGAERSETP